MWLMIRRAIQSLVRGPLAAECAPSPSTLFGDLNEEPVVLPARLKCSPLFTAVRVYRGEGTETRQRERRPASPPALVCADEKHTHTHTHTDDPRSRRGGGAHGGEMHTHTERYK